MLSAISVVAALLAQSAPTGSTAAATAPTVSSVVVQGQKSAVAVDTEIVCHKEKVLGTMFPKEICARRQDIAERRRTDQEQTREATNLRPWKDPAH